MITTWRALQVGALGPIVRYVFSTRSCWGTFPSKLVSASAGALPEHYQGHRAANRLSQASEELSVPAQATEQLSGRVCIAERGGVSCQALPDGSRDSVWDLAGGHVLAHVTYVSEHSPMRHMLCLSERSPLLEERAPKLARANRNALLPSRPVLGDSTPASKSSFVPVVPLSKGSARGSRTLPKG